MGAPFSSELRVCLVKLSQSAGRGAAGARDESHYPAILAGLAQDAPLLARFVHNQDANNRRDARHFERFSEVTRVTGSVPRGSPPGSLSPWQRCRCTPSHQIQGRRWPDARSQTIRVKNNEVFHAGEQARFLILRFHFTCIDTWQVEDVMDPLQVSAQFAAFGWASREQADATEARDSAARFARENWAPFLPLAHEGLGRLLLRIAYPEKQQRLRRRAATSRERRLAIAG
jgi:hypothetical protein